MIASDTAETVAVRAGMYRYFLRKIKELQEILDTERLPESEQQEILRTKSYMETQAQKYQQSYREFTEH